MMTPRKFLERLLAALAVIAAALIAMMIVATFKSREERSREPTVQEPPVGLVPMARSVGLPPELPSAGLPLYFECEVTNVCDAIPAINRRVTLYYQWTPRSDVNPDPSAWISTNMSCVAQEKAADYGWVGKSTFNCWIDAQKAGYIWYYYKVEFDGYAWSGKMKSTDPVTTDSVSPRYAADGVEAEYPITNAPPAQIYTYRTRFTQIKVPIEEN